MTRKLVIVRFLCISLELECTQIFPELFSIFGWTAANLAAVQTLLCLSELHHRRRHVCSATRTTSISASTDITVMGCSTLRRSCNANFRLLDDIAHINRYLVETQCLDIQTRAIVLRKLMLQPEYYASEMRRQPWEADA